MGEAPASAATSLIRVVGEVMRNSGVMFMKGEEGEEGCEGLVWALEISRVWICN